MSTLYINRLTTVDCALLVGNVKEDKTPHAQVLGFSFNVSCNISGEVDPVEKVIVDFGALKKSIKAEIDGLDFGYDHKLIVGSDYEDVTVAINHSSNEATVMDHNKNVLFNGPKNSVRPVNNPQLSKALNDLYIGDLINFFMQGSKFSSYVKAPYKSLLHPSLVAVLNGFEIELKDYIQQRLNALYPNAKIKVDRIDCDIQPTIPGECFYSNSSDLTPIACSQMFPYTHGLKNSTSIGCKNLMHGHLSQLVAILEVPKDTPESEVRTKMIGALSIVNYIALEQFNTHYVWDANLQSDGITEHYNADGRGRFTLSLGDEDESIKSIVPEPTHLTTESTIENLADYIHQQYGESLKSVGIKTIYISEGLHKGSFVNLN